MSRFQLGLLSAFTAQFLWGLFPIYWKWLAHVSSIEVLAHRNFWCAVILGLVVFLSAQRREVVLSVLVKPAEIGRHLISACLIAANWLVFIWAVTNDRVLDASLGYFLSPLVSVALGHLVFKEQLDWRRWCAIGLAIVGVAVMVISSGFFPWIALALAITFGLYGMVRKKAPTGPINGLFIETLLLVPATLLLFLWIARTGDLYYANPLRGTEILLMLAGLVTAIPLVLYTQGARSLPLSLSGMMIFITPSIQFLLGWLFYREPIDFYSWVGFILIWSALVIYVLSQRNRNNMKST